MTSASRWRHRMANLEERTLPTGAPHLAVSQRVSLQVVSTIDDKVRLRGTEPARHMFRHQVRRSGDVPANSLQQHVLQLGVRPAQPDTPERSMQQAKARRVSVLLPEGMRHCINSSKNVPKPCMLVLVQLGVSSLGCCSPKRPRQLRDKP